MCVCVRTITFELNDFSLRYLAGWFILIVSMLILKVKVTGQIIRSPEVNVAKMVGTTSSEL